MSRFLTLPALLLPRKNRQCFDELEANGIENVLALRGDIPKDFEMGENQYFHHAFELVNEIKARGKFCVGAACYPETHPESKNRVDDIARLKEKVDCGVDFITTQMFLIMINFITSVKCAL